VFHSDTLFAGVSSAMAQLGHLEEWLDATARAATSAVCFSSCFPFQGDTLLVAPPRNLWPPQASSKVRWKGARFVPLGVVETLAAGRPLNEGSWAVDAESECLLPARNAAVAGPFRVSVRSSAAVDREGASVTPHATACIEFTPDSGLWTIAAFADEVARDAWAPRIMAAFRLLADSGLGGERSRGWGRAETPQFTVGTLPSLLFKHHAAAPNAYWLLSLFTPATDDVVDWQQGDYELITRGGRVESAAGWGEAKQATRMVSEGSVILSAAAPSGAATDVAPEGFAHPVYRAGFAVAIPIAWRAGRSEKAGA
jgi:CRISPR type III-A-associated RAMP protein Csm4